MIITNASRLIMIICLFSLP